MTDCADFHSYRLYEPSTAGSPRILKLVTRGEGERLVKRNAAEQVFDDDGKLLCFLHVKRANVKKPVASAPQIEEDVNRSNAAFTIPEVQAIAGLHGRSLTSRMTEEQKLRRISRKNGNRLPAEDLVERASNKLRAWNQIGNLMNQVKVVDSVCLS